MERLPFQKSNEVTGYTGNASAYCVPCAEGLHMNAEGEVDNEGNEFGVIFAGTEFDYVPTCDICNHEIDCVVIQPRDY